MYKVGLRVVRGKDWKWEKKDSGEGHLGTLVRLGSKKSKKKVKVFWDNGNICDHRVGYEGAYDLRIFDNSPVGVRHPGVVCDGCNEGIMGFRFNCTVCEDFDFCTYCYMNETSHDPTHVFGRFDTSEEPKAHTLPLRSRSRKVIARGIFKGAIVVSGEDCQHGNENDKEKDLTLDKTKNRMKGTVLNIYSTENLDGGETFAEVQFDSGEKGVFTLDKGELKFVKSSSNGFYFPDHLPLLMHRVKDTSLPSRDAEEFALRFLHYLTEKNARDSTHLEFASVMYTDKMEKALKEKSHYIPEKELQHYHEEAVQNSLQALSKVKPLSEKQINKVKEHVTPEYQKFKIINARKKTLNFPAIGIDFGTTYCCVAVCRNNGEVEIIPNSVGENTTPSYVRLDADEVIVGNHAKDTAYRSLQETIYDLKRMCGRHFNDPNIQKLSKYWPFDLDKGEDGKIQIKVQNQTLLPEQVLTHLLTYLKGTADEFLGDPVINAVITVPAYFDPKQRAITKDACDKVGLNVLQFISEPAAAAVAYGLHYKNEDTKRNCLVFDLGAGTFDIAVLKFHKNKIKIKAIGGDPFLGGVDFDNSMIDYCVEAFEREHRINLMTAGSKSERDKRLNRIKTECEIQKRQLSSSTKAKVSVDPIHGDIPLVVPFTRDVFYKIIKPSVDKCMEIVDQVLRKCEMKETDIDDIMILGGSSRIPYVQSRLSEKFGGRSLLKRVKPEEAVAHGAAILAFNIENPGAGLPSVFIQDSNFQPLLDVP